MIERIIFDWKRTLYDPDREILLPNAMRVLTTLQQDFRLFLIGKGGEEMYAAVDKLRVRGLFDEVIFVPAKTKEVFRGCVPKDNRVNTKS